MRGRYPTSHDISAQYIREATGARNLGLHAFEVQTIPSRRPRLLPWFIFGALTILLGMPLLGALIALAEQ